MSVTERPAPVRSVAQPWQAVARVVMGVTGAQLLAGAGYFTFLAPPEEGGVVTGFDWFVAIWAMASALALLGAAVLRAAGRVPWLELAWWALLAHALWATVKLLAYDEPPAITVVALTSDLVAAAALWAGSRGAGSRAPR